MSHRLSFLHPRVGLGRRDEEREQEQFGRSKQPFESTPVVTGRAALLLSAIELLTWEKASKII